MWLTLAAIGVKGRQMMVRPASELITSRLTLASIRLPLTTFFAGAGGGSVCSRLPECHPRRAHLIQRGRQRAVEIDGPATAEIHRHGKAQAPCV